MAKKPVWKICSVCFNRFESPDEWSINKLFESHFVSTDTGRQCMQPKQLALTFKRDQDQKAWLAR